jgi:hypothetical protein
MNFVQHPIEFALLKIDDTIGDHHYVFRHNRSPTCQIFAFIRYRGEMVV